MIYIKQFFKILKTKGPLITLTYTFSFIIDRLALILKYNFVRLFLLPFISKQGVAFVYPKFSEKDILRSFKPYNQELGKTRFIALKGSNIHPKGVTIQDIVKIYSSKVLVVTHENYFSKFEHNHQKTLCIWHAAGFFKKVGNETDSLNKELGKLIEKHAKFSYLTVSSEAAREYYSSFFNIDVDNVKALGFYKTDLILNSSYMESLGELFYKKHPYLKGKKLYIFVPTLRKTPLLLNLNISLKKISELLKEDEVLIIKLHPGSYIKASQLGGLDKVTNLDLGTPYTNIYHMPDEDILELTFISDVLVTDYSSSISEAMLLNKPVAFYGEDVDIYSTDFCFDYYTELPGELLLEADEVKFVQMLRNAKLSDYYHAFKEKQLGACDGNSTKRIIEFIKHLLKEK